MSCFLILKHLEIKGVNLLSSNYALSAAPIMAISLFGHAMGLKIGAQPSGVAVIHHDAKLNSDGPHQPLGSEGFPGEKGGAQLKGFTSHLFHQRHGAMFINEKDYARETFSLAIQPVATAHIRLSLVFEFSALPDVKKVLAFLRGARIAGGSVQSFGLVKAYTKGDESIFDELPGNGYWLIDRNDLVDASRPDTSFIQALSRLDLGILTPLVVGYALTSEPKDGVCGTRSLSNGDFPNHAFAEPMLGLAEYLPVRHYHDMKIPLWRSGWVSETVYLAAQEG